jgi:hypothetical protein
VLVMQSPMLYPGQPLPSQLAVHRVGVGEAVGIPAAAQAVTLSQGKNHPSSVGIVAGGNVDVLVFEAPWPRAIMPRTPGIITVPKASVQKWQLP